MREEVEVHERGAALRIAQAQAHVLVEVEGARVRERQTLVAVQTDELVVHARRALARRKSEDEAGIPTQRARDSACRFFADRSRVGDHHALHVRYLRGVSAASARSAAPATPGYSSSAGTISRRSTELG